MKIICISGKARSGKDTIGGMIKETLEGEGHSVLVAHYADLVKYICKQFFGWNGLKDEQGRAILQYVGTDVVRAQNQNYWVDFIVDILNLFHDEWDYVIIPDTRFPNEIERLKERGFDVISVRINRSGFDNGLTQEQKNHPSETSLDNATFDFIIDNSGSVSELEEKIYKFVEGNINGTQK